MSQQFLERDLAHGPPKGKRIFVAAALNYFSAESLFLPNVVMFVGYRHEM